MASRRGLPSQKSLFWGVLVERQHLVGVPGAGLFLLAGDGGDGQSGELIDGGGSGLAAIAHQGLGVDGVLGQKRILVVAELGPDVVDVGDELAAQLIDQVQQGMAVEVDPDEGAGDAAFIAGERPGIGGTQGAFSGVTL